MQLKLFVSAESADGPIVPSIVEAYLTHLAGRVRAGTFSSDALDNTSRELQRYSRAHPIAVADCRQSDLTTWLDANPGWSSAHTKKRIVSGIVSCFRWAAEEELIDHCPYRRPKAIMSLAYTARRPAEASEYVLLMRKGSRALRRALFFLRRTGARTCEMRELLWSDVRLDECAPHIALVRHKNAHKTGKVRKIGLDAGTAGFLRAMRRRAAGDHVFTNCDGFAWTRRVFGQHLRRTALRIGLDEGVAQRVTAYCLRHTYACDAVEGGLTSRQVADQLGHSSTDMVDRIYASHTRQHAAYLGDVAAEALKKRKRKSR